MAHETGTSSFSGLTVPEFYSLEDFEELGGGADFNPLIVNALSFASFGKDPAAVTDANVLLLSPQEAHFHPQHGLRDHVAPGYLSCAEIPAGIEPRKLERSTNNREDLDCEVTSTSASTSASPASVSGGDLSDEEHETDCYLKMDDDSDDEFIHSQGAGSAPVFSPKKLRSGVSYALGRGPISVPGKSWSFKPARQTKRVIAVCQGKNNNDDGDSSQIFHFQNRVGHAPKLSTLRGSRIACDPKLLETLLPLGTSEFNKKVRTLQLSNAVVGSLKVARRKVKNARAAQSRRVRVTESLSAMHEKVNELEERYSQLEVENQRLQTEISEIKSTSSTIARSTKADKTPKATKVAAIKGGLR